VAADGNVAADRSPGIPVEAGGAVVAGSSGHWFSVIFALSFQEGRLLIKNQQYWP